MPLLENNITPEAKESGEEETKKVDNRDPNFKKWEDGGKLPKKT